MKTSRSIVAICLALVLALTGHSMSAARGASDATGQMVLCAGTTSVVVYLDETGAPTQAPHYCPDCAFNLLAAVLPDVVLSAFKGSFSQSHQRDILAIRTAQALSAYLSRAPPVLI